MRSFVRATAGLDIGFDAGDETFSSMIALKLFTADKAARGVVRPSVPIVCERARPLRGRYHFFCDDNGFAADTDCTAVAAAALYEAGRFSRADLCASANELLLSAAPEARGADESPDGPLVPGVVMVYWDDGLEPPRGQKQDAAVAANVLYTLLLAEREAGLYDVNGVIERTTRYVIDHLRSGAYLRGTRYYPSPDTFLWYMSCICRRFPSFAARSADDLWVAICTRSLDPQEPGHPADPMSALNLAQRLLAAQQIGALDDVRFLVPELVSLQGSNGAWPAGPYYSLGRRALYFGSEAVTTLFATRALLGAERSTSQTATAPFPPCSVTSPRSPQACDRDAPGSSRLRSA